MKTSNSVLSVVVVCALGLSATLGSPQAFAASYTVYPGNMCVKLDGGANITRTYGSVENHSPTQWLYMDCNVVNDIYSNIASGWIRTTDRHPSAEIWCTLFQLVRRPQDSTIYFVASNSHTGGETNRVQTLYYDRVDPSVTVGSTSHNFYTCYIPPTYNGLVSGIHDYSFIEE